MFVELKTGSDFSGIIDYAIRHKQGKAEVIGGTLSGCPAEERVELMRATATLRPQCRKPVGHFYVGFHHDDRISSPQMVEIGERMLQELSAPLDDCQYLIVRHHDVRQQHCHVIFNRVLADGTLMEDRNRPGLRLRLLAHRLEEEYGLVRALSTPASAEHRQAVERSHPATADGRHDHRRNKFIVHDAVLDALAVCDGSFADLDFQLRRVGIALPAWSFNSKGEFNGASFMLTRPGTVDPELTSSGEPVMYKGSQLGPKPGLSRGVILERLTLRRSALQRAARPPLTSRELFQATAELRAFRQSLRRRSQAAIGYQFAARQRQGLLLRLFDRRQESRQPARFFRTITNRRR